MELKSCIERDLGFVDILVNNAGLIPAVSLREGNRTDIERVLQVNVISHFWVSLECIVFVVNLSRLISA